MLTSQVTLLLRIILPIIRSDVLSVWYADKFYKQHQISTVFAK